MDDKQYDGGLLACAFVLLGSLLVACGTEVPEAEPVIRPVRYQEVVSTGARQQRLFSGTARAGVESELSFRVAGTVVSVSVSVGDRVRQGQEIARVDPTDAQLQVQEAEAGLVQARALERQAAADFDVIRGLYENENASKLDLDGARAQAESTAAQVELVQRRLDLARRQLSYTRLLAPVTGAIASVPVEVNENVSAGQPVAMLTSGLRPEVEVAMPGVLISQISEGDTAEVSFDALPGVRSPAVITEVGVAATGAGATFPVTVQLTEPDSAVRPGMSATVAFQFEAGDDRERIFVPPVAVGEDREGRYVFVLDTGDVEATSDAVVTAKRRAVSVGELGPDGIEVLDGLADGELLVTAGVRRIQDGQQVKLLSKDS